MIADATEVLPRLWVGPAGSCERAPEGVFCICVLEGPHSSRCVHCRILGDDGKATAERLGRVRELILAHWPREEVLLHCGAGQERSPLALAFFISRSFGLSFGAVYDWLIKVRPQTLDRRDWFVGGSGGD